jgi:malate/lactate dehydrogenase
MRIISYRESNWKRRTPVYLLNSLRITTDAADAFVGCEVAILLGGFPRLPGMERRDLLIKNVENIKAQADALNRTANRDVKVVVVANPANTNCLVAINAAPNIPPANFTCLTRLDEERLRGMCAKRISEATQSLIKGKDIHNVFTFGNHSNTQVLYIGEATYISNSDQKLSVAPYFSTEEMSDLIHRVQNRGAEIIKCLQLSSALSAVEVVAKHIRDWLGVSSGRFPLSENFSMGVLLQESAYGLYPGIVYSLPCERSSEHSCGYRIRKDLIIAESVLSLMRISENELLEERSDVAEYL